MATIVAEFTRITSGFHATAIRIFLGDGDPNGGAGGDPSVTDGGVGSIFLRRDVGGPGVGFYKCTSTATWQIEKISSLLDVQLFGADPTKTFDSSAAIQSAIDVAAAAGLTVYLSRGTYAVGTLFFRDPGSFQLNWRPAAGMIGDGPTASVLTPFNADGAAFLVSILEPHLGAIGEFGNGAVFRDFGVSGNARSKEVNGISVQGGNVRLQNIAFTGIDGCGLLLSSGSQVARESSFVSLSFRSCGRYSATDVAPSLKIATATNDKTNNLYFLNTTIEYPWYAGRHVVGQNKVGASDNTRDVYFANLSVRGWLYDASATALGQVSKDAALILLEGNVSNAMFAGLSVQDPSSDVTDKPPVRAPCVGIRFIANTDDETPPATTRPSRAKFLNVTGKAATVGRFIQIDAATDESQFANVAVAPADFPDGQLYVRDLGTDDLIQDAILRFASCGFNPALTLVPTSRMANVDAPLKLGARQFTADTVATDGREESTIFVATHECFVNAMHVLPNTVINQLTPSNYATIVFYVRRSGVQTELVRLETWAQVIDAWSGASILPAQTSTAAWAAMWLAPGDCVTVAIGKVGTGILLPQLTLQATIRTNVYVSNATT